MNKPLLKLGYPKAKVVALTSLTNILAEHINELRKTRGLTVNGLATMSGVPYSTVNSIICGKSKSPTLATLIRIAAAFNMTIVEFLDVPELVNFSFEDDEDSAEEDIENTDLLP